MKVGMNILLWTDQPNCKEHTNLLKSLKQWGFDGAELSINDLTLDTAKEFGKIFKDIGLEPISAITLDAAQCDPASEDVIKRNNAVAEIKRAVDKTLLLGGDIIAGPIFQGLVRFSGSGPTLKEWNCAVDCIRQASSYARQYGVKLALEPINRFEMYIVNTLEDGFRFINEVNLDNVGLLADTFHSNLEEKNTVEAWQKVITKIYYVHISENDRGIPGTGHAIPVELFSLLKKSGYNGWLTIEAFNDNVPGLKSRLHLWRSLAPKEEDIAIQGLEFIRKNLN